MTAQTMVAPATQTHEQPHQTPSRKQVIKAIIHDAWLAGRTVSPRDAAYLDDMIGEAVAEIRAKRLGGATDCMYYLSGEDMHRIHNSGLLDAVVPDERVAPVADSAHELLGRRHLQGSELALVHTFGERRGGRYCAVAIAVDTTSAT